MKYTTNSIFYAYVVFLHIISSSPQMKRQQQHIFDTLSAHKINYFPVDVAASTIVKNVLKAESPIELKLPQIWRGKVFLGGHEEFENSVEGDYLKEFLKETAE